MRLFSRRQVSKGKVYFYTRYICYKCQWKKEKANQKYKRKKDDTIQKGRPYGSGEIHEASARKDTYHFTNPGRIRSLPVGTNQEDKTNR
jgi:hypothetical protein